ncbi:hypothetical protein PspLS_02557 [Pyricularia sp. CBS 133598]|nr:hypothetical protein PspLS_02557 [Pyricularia sp. CBS 133598]
MLMQTGVLVRSHSFSVRKGIPLSLKLLVSTTSALEVPNASLVHRRAGNAFRAV